jgi:hypothetical protein
VSDLAGQSWDVPRKFDIAIEDRGLRCVDVNRDGYTDLVVNNESRNVTYLWSPEARTWQKASPRLPRPGMITDETGTDRGHRFVDVNSDGYLDSVHSNEAGYAVALYDQKRQGWATSALSGVRPAQNAMPPITVDGRLNGAWFRNGIMYVVNEHTSERQCHTIQYAVPAELAQPE